jgi:hypothetical protein
MDSNELKAVRQKAQDYVTTYLADCCRDELEWQNTGILRDGKLRVAARIFSVLDPAHALPLAQSEVKRQAMEQVVARDVSLPLWTVEQIEQIHEDARELMRKMVQVGEHVDIDYPQYDSESPCWSCCAKFTTEQRAAHDGNCPHCGAEQSLDPNDE